MKLHIVAISGLALALAACGSSDKAEGDAAATETAPAASEAAASEPAAAAAPAAAPAKGDKPTREFIVGKWGTNGDCELAMDLRADGTSDGPFGNWTYADGVLGFVDAPEMKISVTVVDDKTMESRNSASSDGGSKAQKMTRC